VSGEGGFVLEVEPEYVVELSEGLVGRELISPLELVDSIGAEEANDERVGL
jgi:hypothetical protein